MNAQNSTNVSRRDALRTIGAGVMLAGWAAVTGRARGADAPAGGGSAPAGALDWELPKLPYTYHALEPHIDARTMEIHHTKHHQAYITNAKKLLEARPDLLARGPEALVSDLASVPESIRTGIRNHAGGHVNHAFFWKIIAPDTGASIGQLPVAIAGEFGSMEEFKKQFADAALKRFGSGWAWLVRKAGRLQVASTANQDSPLSDSAHPIIGLDVWEHAYYLHYQNRRADYIAAFWNVLNWTQAEENYGAALRG